jgi:hypothetical protein
VSNTKNLANLASALDDGTSGQILQSTGSGGVAFADAGGSGVTAHTNQDAMISADASSPYTEGSLHYDLALNKLFVKMGSAGGSGFFQIAEITNATPVISSPSANAIFPLNSDGTSTTVSITATDDDVGQTLNYYYVVTTGSIGSTATVTTSATSSGTFSSSGNAVAGSSNASTNSHFKFTPSTNSAHEGSFDVTFYVTDGTNTVSRTSSFTLRFVVFNSKFTRLLLSTDSASTGGGGNQTITDTPRSGASAKTITSYGVIKPSSGTFSPYRHGGYSVYFDGADDTLSLVGSGSAISTARSGSGFTIEGWYYPDAASGGYDMIYGQSATNGYQTAGALYYNGGNGELYYARSSGSSTITSSEPWVNSTWNHFAVTSAGSSLKLYINGVLGGSATDASFSGTVDLQMSHTSYYLHGFIKDFRVSNTVRYSGNSLTVPTEAFSNDTNTLLLCCHAPYFADGSSNDHTITTSGNPAIEPISPYDNAEYSESKHGGSIFFDGYDDYLLIDDHADFDMTGDFTIKFWAYHTEIPTSTGNERYTLFDNYYFNGGGLSLSIMGQYSGKAVLYWMNGGSLSVNQLNFIPKTQQWYFYELTRSSDSLTIKVNGDTIGTINVTNLANPARSLLIGVNTSGSSNADNSFMKGYIADFQYVTGTTAPESSIPTELMSTHSSSALHIKCTDAAILDKSQRNYLKLYGAANSTDVLTSSSTPPYIGAAWQNTSAVKLLQSSSQDHIFAEEFDLSNSAFTIESWVYLTDATGERVLIDFRPNGTSTGDYFNLNFAAGVPKLQTPTLTSSVTLSANTWYHLAVTKDTSSSTHVLRMYVDGTKVAQANDNRTWLTGTDRPLIGAIGYNTTSLSGYYFKGYIQDFRISIGLARYTADNETSNIPSSPLKG